MTLVEIILKHADDNPEKLCIVDENREYTYFEFANYIKQLSAILNLYYKNTILVQNDQSASFLALKFACELTGNIFVPVEKEASLDSIKEIMNEVEASIFFTNKVYENCKTEMIPKYIESKANEDKKRIIEISEILFTTGTTGKSKGVIISNLNNIAIAENIIFGSEMKKDNIELIVLPISHSHALRSCYANLLNGSSIVLIDGVIKIKKIFDYILKYKVNSMDFSPSAFNTLLKLAEKKLVLISNNMDYLEFGTSVLDENTKEKIKNIFSKSRLYNFYGSTESGRSCVSDFSKNSIMRCIGKPTRNASFIIVDENKNIIKSSEKNPGLLACMGPMNMLGYWKQNELTNATLINGYVYTNDLAYIDDGNIYIFGRNGNVINYGGIKIAPEEIEEKILNYDKINDCACVPKKDENYGQIPFLYIEVKKDNDFDMAQFIKYIKNHVDNNKLPKHIEIIDKIPRTYNGKIIRKELIEKCNQK